MDWTQFQADRWLDPQKLLSGFVGFAAGLFVESLKSLILRPYMKLSFHENFVIDAPTIDDDTKLPSKARYVRVRASNRWRITAKNCQPYLASIERVEGSTAKLLFDDAIPLRWSQREGDEPIDVPPGMHFHIDVVSATRKESRFRPSTKRQPVYWNQELSKHGTYKLKIVLTADAMPPQQIKLVFTWQGDPSELKVSSEGVRRWVPFL